MINQIKYFLLYCMIINTVSAQKKLNYNDEGKLSKVDYTALLKTNKIQAISAFDTVSLKPLLVYAIYIKDKKLGILDDTGRKITPPIYDGIEGLNLSYTSVMFGFHETYPVKIGKKYGLISNTGKTILPVEYDYVHSEAKTNTNTTRTKEAVIDSLIIVNNGNEELYFSPQGKKISKPNTTETAATERNNEYGNAENSSNTKTTQETTSYGNIIKKLDNNFAIVEAKVDNKYYYQGLVDVTNNKLVLPVVYNYLLPDQKNRLIAIKDKKYTLHDFKGNLALKDTYDNIENYGTIYKIKKGTKTALFDLDLNQKTDFIFDYFSSSGPDFMVVKKAGKEGVITPYGDEIIPFTYDRVEAYFNLYASGVAFYKVTKNNKKGILSITGKPITEIVYDEITPECTIEEPSPYGDITMPIDHDYDPNNNAYFIIKKEGKFGLLDNNFKPLLPNKYDELKKSFHKDFVIVGKKKLNKNNYDLSLLKIKTDTTILPYEYDFFKYLGGQYFMIYKGSIMGVCDFEGKIIVPMASYKDLSDRYFFSTIYAGLGEITGRNNYFLTDYQNNKIDMTSN